MKSGVEHIKVSYEDQAENINRIFKEANAYKHPNENDMKFHENRKI